MHDDTIDWVDAQKACVCVFLYRGHDYRDAFREKKDGALSQIPDSVGGVREDTKKMFLERETERYTYFLEETSLEGCFGGKLARKYPHSS